MGSFNYYCLVLGNRYFSITVIRCNYVFRMMRSGSGKKHRKSVGNEDMGKVGREEATIHIP